MPSLTTPRRASSPSSSPTLTEAGHGGRAPAAGRQDPVRILEGFRKPSFLPSLEAFRKAIGASPKRFERFEELKHSPSFDVDVLTDVFPCWIMRPEDACRVFPLRPDVFDVVIFDEASQCNPDQVLPLFAARVASLIVGDDKQLSNEDLRRSLSTNANTCAPAAKPTSTGSTPPGLFDQTRNSLLELASHRQQAAVLLNEHFRCRPRSSPSRTPASTATP